MHLCLSRDDWKRGLPHLVKGSDEKLKTAAQMETALPPEDAEGQIRLADAWWDLAQSRHSPVREQILLHAGSWYERAHEAIPAGLLKTKVERRQAEIAAADTGKLPFVGVRPPLAWAPFDEKKAQLHQKRWAHYLRMPVVQTNSIGMRLVLIPPGEFDMGSPQAEVTRRVKGAKDMKAAQWILDVLASEGPQHRVRITRPFWLGITVVTQEEYERVMGKNPSEFSASGKQKAAVAGRDTRQFPVETVTWDNAVEFCRRLSDLPEVKRTARKWRYSLPTEAQWEYACRAGNPGRWFFSPQPDTTPDEDVRQAV